MNKLLFATILLFSSVQANAKVLAFEFTGTIISLEYESNDVILRRKPATAQLEGTSVAIGQHFTGTFSYDSEAVAHTHPQGIAAFYIGGIVPAPASIRFTSSGMSFTSPTATTNAYITDFKGVYINFLNPLENRGSLNLTFDGEEDGKLDVSLPDSLDLDAFRAAYTELSVPDATGTLRVTGLLTSLAPTSPVPEPAGYALMLAGLAVLSAGAHRALPRGEPA